MNHSDHTYLWEILMSKPATYIIAIIAIYIMLVWSAENPHIIIDINNDFIEYKDLTIKKIKKYANDL